MMHTMAKVMAATLSKSVFFNQGNGEGAVSETGTGRGRDILIILEILVEISEH